VASRPIVYEADGTPAQYRIVDPRTYFLTVTFDFSRVIALRRLTPQVVFSVQAPPPTSEGAFRLGVDVRGRRSLPAAAGEPRLDWAWPRP